MPPNLLEALWGKSMATWLPQKRGVVNIYDVRIVDLAGNVIHEQQFEPRARFSLGGEKSAVFGEYDAQGLTYVDPADGKNVNEKMIFQKN